MARTKVLRRLDEQGPTRQNVLATDFGLSPHSITDIVDGLERLGMAERLRILPIAGPSSSRSPTRARPAWTWRTLRGSGCSSRSSGR